MPLRGLAVGHTKAASRENLIQKISMMLLKEPVYFCTILWDLWDWGLRLQGLWDWTFGGVTLITSIEFK